MTMSTEPALLSATVVATLMQTLYVNDLLELGQAEPPPLLLLHSLVPRFTLELSGATVRAGGLAASWPQKLFFSEALTAALPLHGNRHNARDVACVLDALLTRLPDLVSRGPGQPEAASASPHAMWPGDLLERFRPSEYCIDYLQEQLQGSLCLQGSLYLVSGGDPKQRVVKYFGSSGESGAESASMDAQRAWHAAGVAPTVVRAMASQ